ncbi:MAG: MFS transporter, partial [Myxococcaceae bacterium]
TLCLAGLQGTAATAHAALNGLMAATTRVEDKGRTGGWQMAGNVGGTSLLGTLAIFLASRISRPLAGMVLAGIVLVASAGIFWIPARGFVASVDKGLSRWLKHVKAIGKDLWSVMGSAEGRMGLFILLMPIGAGALTNIFSGMATAYSADQRTVEWVNGIGMGLTGAAGALVGGFIADKLDRKVAYVLAGGVTALCALGMAAGPLNPTTYAAGILSYSFANGIAFASFAGLVLQIVGSGAAVTTKYTLFVAASNFAISYTTALAGYGSQFRSWGVRGSLLFDAGQTFVGIVAVSTVLLILKTRTKPQPAAT